MISNQYFEQFHTPSNTRFLAGIVARLGERRSAIVLIPALRQLRASNIMNRLKELAAGYNLPGKDLVVRDVTSYEELLRTVLGQMGVPIGNTDEVRNLRDFYQYLDSYLEDLRFDLLWVESLLNVTELSRSMWLRFLQELADYNRTSRYAPNRALTFCLVDVAKPLLPELKNIGDALLAIEWWWSVTSVQEAHILCRSERSSLFNPDQDAEQFAKDLWREYVFPAYAAGEIGLVDWLWNRWRFEDSDEDVTLGALRSYARYQGWKPEQFTGLPFREEFQQVTPRFDPLVVRHSPPLWARELWSTGALCWTPEYGLEIHTAALALLERTNEVWHRFWRGQVALLLPMIDHLRLLACAHLNMQNPNWWKRCYHPQHHKDAYRRELRKNPYKGELGHLYSLIEDGDLRCDDEWMELLSLMQRLRNTIAHYQYIHFYEFQDFWDRLKQLSKRYEVAF